MTVEYYENIPPILSHIETVSYNRNNIDHPTGQSTDQTILTSSIIAASKILAFILLSLINKFSFSLLSYCSFAIWILKVQHLSFFELMIFVELLFFQIIKISACKQEVQILIGKISSYWVKGEKSELRQNQLCKVELNGNIVASQQLLSSYKAQEAENNEFEPAGKLAKHSSSLILCIYNYFSYHSRAPTINCKLISTNRGENKFCFAPEEKTNCERDFSNLN